MGDLTDTTKGKAKEIGGVVSGNRSLEIEGKKDQAKGWMKRAWERFKADVREAFRRRQRQPVRS